MELLFSDSTFRLVYHSSVQAIETTFLGFLSGPDLRDAYNLGLDAAARHRAVRWLSDHHQMRAVRLADQDWLALDYSPRFVARIGRQLQRSAIVASVDPMNQLFTRDVIDRTSGIRPWEFDVFDTRAEAWDWLTRPLPAD